jgi:hypothetical protein
LSNGSVSYSGGKSQDIGKTAKAAEESMKDENMDDEDEDHE